MKTCCPNNTFKTQQAFALSIGIIVLCLLFEYPSGLGMNILSIVGIVVLPLVVISLVVCYWVIKKYKRPVERLSADT